METVKVVIDEASMYDSLKDIDKLPKSVLHLTLGSDKGVGEQDSSPLAHLVLCKSWKTLLHHFNLTITWKENPHLELN